MDNTVEHNDFTSSESSPESRDLDKIQWHPGFCSAMEREFRSNRDDLLFERELQVTHGPLFVDLMMIRNMTGKPMQNEIGQIFRKYNLFEFKNPNAGLNIDVFYKVVGYACLYKSQGDTINQIPAEELTMTFVRDSYPRGLMHSLRAAGLTIRRQFPGVYYVVREPQSDGNLLFPTQIIVTHQLRPETHSSLRILRRGALEEDVRRFLRETKFETKQGERNLVDSILQVSVYVNEELYHKVRGDLSMCQALRDLMKDVIEEDVRAGVEQGLQQGLKQGIEQGIQQGMEQGIQQGIQQGMEQGVKLGKTQGIELGKTQGRIQASVEIYSHEMKLDELTIVKKISDTFHLTTQQAKEYVNAILYSPEFSIQN